MAHRSLLSSHINRRKLVLATGAMAIATPALSRLDAGAQDPMVATMVTNTEGIGDEGFNDLALEGGERAAAEFGIEFNVLESQTAADYVPYLTDAAESGDLVVGVGFLITDALAEISAQFPDTYFAIIDSEVEGDNIVSYLFREQEGAFLAGVLAASMTQTGQVGFVGGIRVPPVWRHEVGFVAGARSINPDIQVRLAYADDFDDPDLGRLLALAHFDNGADIVHAAAGRTGVGALDAAAEQGEGFYVIAADRDQSGLGEDIQLGAVIKATDVAMYEAIESVLNDEFEPGTYTRGIADDFVELGALHPNVPEDVRATINAYSAAIADGTIVPPVDDETLETFEPVSPDHLGASASPPASPEATPASSFLTHRKELPYRRGLAANAVPMPSSMENIVQRLPGVVAVLKPDS